MTEQITPLILSGGAGTRLWPLSTPDRPKQFLQLHGEGTMIAQTLRRIENRECFAPPLLVGSKQHESLLLEALADVDASEAKIILEPCPRNTAPAIALGAIEAGEDALLLVMPSDHVIGDVEAFQKAINRALPAAQQGHLVTFGIEPSRAETGFGYIRQGTAIAGASGVFESLGFVEKPDLTRAEDMLLNGGFSWNAGIFLFRADVFLDELKRQNPTMYDAARAAMSAATRRDAIIEPGAEQFAAAPANSIDYAIMESAKNVAVVPMSCGWSDVGSWDALADISPSDARGNVFIGKVTELDCSGTLVSTDGLRVNAIGLRDTIIVAADDEILIVPRGQSQRVKELHHKIETSRS